MNIRPKIPIYLGGSTLDLDKWILENQKYYDWYSKLYPNAQILQGNPLKLRLDNADFKQLSSSHHTTDDLRRSAYNNYLYTKDYDARLRDLIYWSEQLKGLDKLTDLQIVDLYNTQAKSIRDAREAPQTYNKTGYSGTNLIFRKMFYNRSMLGTNTPDYNIGYLENLDNIIGTSTWQRRMDRYENPFDKDTQEGQQNRTFYINIPGTDRLVKVYKKENGDLGLFPNSPNTPPSDTTQQQTQKQNGVQVGQKDDTPNDFWSKLQTGFKNIAPDLLDALRLAGNMHNNERVYNEMKQAIIPNLLQSYHTYRQVVGDEATKQAYYRRAVQGQTKAGLPFTSDADRLMAYMQEARRIGDELRAQGDLADNQRIRETSAEAAAHADANTERDTTVANLNITELNKAAAAKHQLNAQKYSADWTNIDLYLLGWQNRLLLKKAKQQALLELVDLLTMLDAIYDDPAYKKAYENLQAVVKKHTDSSGTIDSSAPEVIEAQRALRKAKNNYLINYYSTKMAKSGMKITKKDTSDKFLYKTSRDIVEHFRKMSKMTDDSRVRTIPKPVKLTSHPKKYLLGGVAPFTIYRPLGAVGGETTTLVTSSTEGAKSSKDTAAKDKLDMVKEMFKAVQNSGLPVDVNVVYRDLNNLFSRAQAFGEELSTDDIATIYLQSMLKISNLKYSKENYDKALAVATANDSLNELAVDASGNYVVLDKDSNISIVKSLEEAKEKGLNPITNQLLLDLRAYSQNLAFRKGDYIVSNIINNGMGINKIGAQIKALAENIGSTEGKLEGISQIESGKIRKGLEMLAEAPSGYYLITNHTKDLLSLVQAALKYIENMLSPSLKAILEAHGGTKLNIALFLTSQLDYVNELTISPLTGKASDKGLGSGGKGDISSNPLLDMLREIGGMYLNYSLVTKDSNTKLSVNGTFYSLLPKISEDMSIDKMLSVSGIGGIIQGKKGITFGNLEIKPEDLKHIMYSNNGGMVVTLPCKIVNGIKLVNLDIVETYEKAEQKALQVNSDRNSSQFIQTLALELKNEHLDSLLDSNELPNKNMFGQFLVVDAYTSDKIKFDINSKYVEKIENPDEELELRMSKALSTDNKKSDYALDVKDHWTMFEGTWDDIYKGTVFIPLNNNPNAALNTWGNSAKIGQTTELEELYLISNKSSKFNGNNTLE